MSNILITSAGRRVELVDSFKAEGKKIDKNFQIYLQPVKFRIFVLKRQELPVKNT